MAIALARRYPKRSSDPDGRYPAEGAVAQRCIGRGKGTYIGAVFNNFLGQLNRYH